MTLPEESSAVKAITKNSIREQVYADFDSKGLQKAWRPIRHHIPRFPTIQEAVNKLAELPEYQNALTVVTKTGNTLKDVRLKALKDQKKLLVPIPFPSDTGTLYLVEAPESADDKVLQKYVTRFGLHDKSKVVPADSKYRADIIILGSVAVDKQGRRIGSGKDYCDLELAVMVQKGMITKDTIMATIVHDIQVMEALPEELFREHDVVIGLIITPTQTIRVSPPPAPPSGILWKLLTKSMLQVVPILGELHDLESKTDPSACELKEDDVKKEVRPRRHILRRRKPIFDKEEQEGPDRRLNRKVRQRKPKGEVQGGSVANGSEQGDGESVQAPRADRPRRRRIDDVENGARWPRRPYQRRKYQIDFSLCVRNLASDVRVRDLKNALAECHVKPAEIKWRGQEGYAVLHFARDEQETDHEPTSIDGMISSLRNLKVSAGQDEGLVVEPYNRVTRIEVTDQVTAV